LTRKCQSNTFIRDFRFKKAVFILIIAHTILA